MTKDSQRLMVMLHLDVYGSITSIEAFQLYGITRLASIIFNLRKANMNIVTDTVEGKTRYGNPTHYARYYLVREETNNAD